MSQHAWPVGPDTLESTPESDPASLSPRTALLSPPFENERLRDDPRGGRRGPGVKFRHERERVHSTASPRELIQMLVTEEYESKQMRKILYTAFDRLENETRRADDAEGRIDETIQRAKSINQARISAEQQAMRSQEELKLYKLQLDNAQKEILRAQEVLKAIEAQRDEAEAAAVSARSKARRLNEERLIELAREEGRRLGFEEGVRRGRRMGFREAHAASADDRDSDMHEVANAVVERLLEDRDEREQIEHADVPTPIPPPSSSRSAPEVHRLESPVISTLENHRHSSRSRRNSPDTLRRPPDLGVPPPPSITEARIIPSGIPTIPTISSQASRSQPQPWPGPPAEPSFSRPSSVQNSPPSVRHSPIHVPPDGFIPTADSNHNISLPPPHELHRNIPSPTPSQRTLGHPSERGRGRDYMYDNFPPPRRASPDESLASTKQSAASTISQLDIVGLPSNGRPRPQNLSVIHEDASMRSEQLSDYSQTAGSASHAGRSSFREMRSNETLRRDRKSKQRLADELRYSDPSEAEQWRQQSESSRSQRQSDVPPPRHRPSHITVPTPLSPPRVLQHPDARLRRAASERQGRPETRSEYGDHRRPLSSDSSVPEINVEPPSGPPSDAPSRGRGNIPTSGLLSPDHANLPLPLPVPAPPTATNGRSSPVMPPDPDSHTSHANGHVFSVVPEMSFFPSPGTNGSSQAPVIPKGSGPSQRPIPPYGPPSSERSEREAGRSRTPISFYAASPVPPGVTYPAPPVSRSVPYAYPPTAGSNPSVTSEGRGRHDSLGVASSGSRSNRPPVQTTGSSATDGSGGGGARSARESRASRRPSNASMSSHQSRPSYSRYNPKVYNDPAYLASNGSLVDSVTDANTTANGGGPVRPVRIRGSPGYSYATLRTNE